VPSYRTLFSIFFTSEPVGDYEDAKAAAAAGTYGRFFHAMLRRGVALAPSAYEVGFCSLAHSDRDIERTIGAAREAAAEIAVGEAAAAASRSRPHGDN
jgi:glutamate-1-semialdehyde 2,1-aminomutase